MSVVHRFFFDPKQKEWSWILKLNGVLDLSYCKLNYANLNGAELNYAELNGAELNCAELNCAKLNGAVLNYAELNKAELSGAKLNKVKLTDYFAFDAEGLLCFKIFGLYFAFNQDWSIKNDSFIEENCNPNRTNDCGCGVNVATIKWLKEQRSDKPIWVCRIRYEDLPFVVVPYNFEGKLRCERLELIRELTVEEVTELE